MLTAVPNQGGADDVTYNVTCPDPTAMPTISLKPTYSVMPTPVPTTDPTTMPTPFPTTDPTCAGFTVCKDACLYVLREKVDEVVVLDVVPAV